MKNMYVYNINVKSDISTVLCTVNSYKYAKAIIKRYLEAYEKNEKCEIVEKDEDSFLIHYQYIDTNEYNFEVEEDSYTQYEIEKVQILQTGYSYNFMEKQIERIERGEHL